MHWLDPSVLPSVRGNVAHYTFNAHGDVDGVLLDDDRQVHVPPHLGRALERLVRPGDAVEARYVKPRGADVFAAVSISAAGKTLVDDGPPHKGHGPERDARVTRPMHVHGQVRVTLHAPKGEVCGAVLDDGTQLRVDPKANGELAPCFATGALIDVWGDGLKRKGVTVVDVHEIAFSGDLA